jgi:hypothetical protein
MAYPNPFSGGPVGDALGWLDRFNQGPNRRRVPPISPDASIAPTAAPQPALPPVSQPAVASGPSRSLFAERFRPSTGVNLPAPTFGGAEASGPGGATIGLGSPVPAGEPLTRALPFIVPTSAQPTTQPQEQLPLVFNGDVQYRQAENPVHDAVARGMGSRDGRIPSIQEFMRTMPQTMTMNFGSGSGQLIPGRPDAYTPAFQGPEQRSDHTNAAMAAYNNMLGQYTTGPESPSQRAARLAETNTRYGQNGTVRQDSDTNRMMAEANTNRDRETQRLVAGMIAQGVEPERAIEIGRQVHGAQNQPGVTGPGAEFRSLADQSLRTAVAPGGPGQPSRILPTTPLPQRNAAIANFLMGLSQQQMNNPQAVLEFLRQPGQFGGAEALEQFLAQGPGLFRDPRSQTTRDAIERLRMLQSRGQSLPRVTQ